MFKSCLKVPNTPYVFDPKSDFLNYSVKESDHSSLDTESIILGRYLGSCPAMIIWNTPTQAPLFPSQYSGLGSSLSNTSKALAA